MIGDNDQRVRQTILELCRTRYPKTICPSEVARALNPTGWRPLMPQVRAVAAALQTAGTIRITQGGHDVDPAITRGPLRLKKVDPTEGAQSARDTLPEDSDRLT